MGELEPGTLLTTLGGDEATVTDLSWREAAVDVFNFEVEGVHNYVVSARGGGGHGVLVHNSQRKCKITGGGGQRNTEVVTANGQKAAPEGTRLGPSGKPEFHNSDSPTRKAAIDGAKNDPQGSGQMVTDSAATKQAQHYHSVKSDGSRVSGPGKTHYNKRGDKPKPPEE